MVENNDVSLWQKSDTLQIAALQNIILTWGGGGNAIIIARNKLTPNHTDPKLFITIMPLNPKRPVKVHEVFGAILYQTR